MTILVSHHRSIARTSATRALRVVRVGMWMLLAIILSLMAKNWRELRDRLELIDQTRFTTAQHAPVSCRPATETVSILPP